MSTLKSGIVLSQNENLVLEIESKLVATSSFLILRFFLSIIRFIAQIIGIGKKGFLVITNKRVVEVYYQTIIWGVLTVRKTVKNVPLSAIKEVDYNKMGTFAFFFRSYHLFYRRFYARIYAILKGQNEKETQKAVNLFYEAIYNV